MYVKRHAVVKDGKRYVYLRLVEAYRDESGRVRHRVLRTLGREVRVDREVSSNVFEVSMGPMKMRVARDDIAEVIVGREIRAVSPLEAARGRGVTVSIAHPEEMVRPELNVIGRTVEEATGESPRFFRPPFGGRRPQTLRIARSLGLQPVMWNVTSWDWKKPPAARIVQKCTGQMHGGDVILMHDGDHEHFGADRWQTIVATHLLIESWREKGYDFVTVPQMMGGPLLDRRPSVVG